MRTFQSPSGRQWVAQVVFLPLPRADVARAALGEREVPVPAVLRFTSESIVLELREWPDDWESLPDETLTALARRAQPPALGLSAAGEEGARG